MADNVVDLEALGRQVFFLKDTADAVQIEIERRAVDQKVTPSDLGRFYRLFGRHCLDLADQLDPQPKEGA